MKVSIKIFACCIVLLTGQIKVVNAATIDIAIALDSSGSMLNGDRLSTSIEITKWLISSFDTYESTSDNEYRFGIIQFGGGGQSTDPVANIEYSFTDDQTLSSVISAVDNLVHIQGFTPTALAMEQTINLFNTQSSGSFNKHLFIITDGVPTDGYDSCSSMPTNFGTTVFGIEFSPLGGEFDCLLDNHLSELVVGANLNEFSGYNLDALNEELTAVPVPAAVWLFGSGLIGLMGIAKSKKT